jgi:DNA ligase (NAD+)
MCPARLKWRVQYFASRDAMDIEHLGASTIDKLIEKNMITTIADLYFLTKGDLLQLEGIKEKSAQNLLDSIQESKKKDLSRLIYGLGIRHVGKYAAQLLATQYHSIDELAQATAEELKTIYGLGEKTADAIASFFATDENKQLLRRLKEIGVKTKTHVSNQHQPFKGKQFVFTGTLEHLTRSKAKELVEKKGGIVASSVSKKSSNDTLCSSRQRGYKY